MAPTRRPIFALVALALAASASVAAASPSPVGDDVVETCEETVPDPSQLCRSAEAGLDALATLCRQVPGVALGICDELNGKILSQEAVDAYGTSWAHEALTLQRDLQSTEPLGDTVFPSTHNSYNAAAYSPTLSGLDPNQQYGIADQLELDIRGLELDVHWFPSVSAGGNDALLCHGTAEHGGCTTERPLRAGLAEIAAWLQDNPDEVVLIDIEAHLDGAEGEAVAAGDINAVLGDRIYKAAPATECNALPLELTTDDVRAAGKQVLITSSCGGGDWNAIVHSTENRKQTLLGGSFTSFPQCGADFSAADYAGSWIRYWEDSTWLAEMTGTKGAEITPAMVREMVRCGVNQPSIDQLVPTDERLESLVWSWAKGHPRRDLGGLDCAANEDTGRFVSLDCNTSFAFVCAAPAGTFHVTSTVGPWSSGPATCAAAGMDFTLPRTPGANEALRKVKKQVNVTTAWVDYAKVPGSGWTPEATDAGAATEDVVIGTAAPVTVSAASESEGGSGLIDRRMRVHFIGVDA